MTLVRDRDTELADSPQEPDRLLAKLGWPILVCVLTAVLAALVPVVGGNLFYLRGDSFGQFLPTYYHLGMMVRGGHWPPAMDPATWTGGDYAAEGLFGIYNPINTLNWVMVSLLPDLAVAALLLKAEFLVLLALGTYLVAREYGAARWASSVVAVSVPFAGYTLYWDTSSWLSGLIAFSYVPWVWWSLRRAANRRLSPVIAFLIGALAITQGNPYGVLGVAVVGVALVVELALQRKWKVLIRLLMIGGCVAIVIPLVFLPLIDGLPLTHRDRVSAFSNDGFMRPSLGDFFNLSSPTFLPNVRTFINPMMTPAAYFAWYVVPLLPWLRWRRLRGVRLRLSALTGIAVFFTLYVLLTLSPSRMWLFRWPLRLIEYAYLGLAIAFAIWLSQGLQRDHPVRRAAATTALVLFFAWITLSQDPQRWLSTVVAMAVVLGLTALVVVVATRVGAWKATASVTAMALALQLGTVVVLALQVHVYSVNASAGQWGFPTSVSGLQHRFGDRFTGTTVQVAGLNGQRRNGGANLSRLWVDFLLGSMYPVAGVSAVNMYSGMGYDAFTKKLCLTYNGTAHACTYTHLWKPLKSGGPPLADLMKVQTVVIQNALVPTPRIPAGWRVIDADTAATVIGRKSAVSWPHGRLSHVTSGVQASGDRSTMTNETVQVTTSPGGAGTLTFARLAWPGYSASIDGKSVAIKPDAVGLVTVDVPGGVTGTLQLHYRPPGQVVGLALLLVGLLITGGLSVFDVRRRRRDRARTVAKSADSRPPELDNRTPVTVAHDRRTDTSGASRRGDEPAPQGGSG
ncbi:MAG: hypothetical protein ACR2KG_07485 [Nocardioidaceae bacterium]